MTRRNSNGDATVNRDRTSRQCVLTSLQRVVSSYSVVVLKEHFVSATTSCTLRRSRRDKRYPLVRRAVFVVDVGVTFFAVPIGVATRGRSRRSSRDFKAATTANSTPSRAVIAFKRSASSVETELTSSRSTWTITVSTGGDVSCTVSSSLVYEASVNVVLSSSILCSSRVSKVSNTVAVSVKVSRQFR